MSCVLIVEDYAAVREALDLLLRREGFATMCAANGQEALARMRERRPCIVLLDMQMPVLDGFGFRELQLQDPDLANVPVVCLTAVHAPERVERALGLTCRRKPVDPALVIADVAAHCAHRL